MFQLPDAPSVSEHDVDALVEKLRDRRVAVLTGAGCSTESGIPDYRSPGQLERVRRPIQHQAFVKSAEVRARYWARSLLGWPRFSSFAPNPAHRALAWLEHRKCVHGLITQNVDQLHQRAGSSAVIELHGALARVKCLACGEREERDALQQRLHSLNPGFAETFAPELRPDGDAELPPEVEHSFRVPACLHCEGMLKPEVVFFGDNVAPQVVGEAMSWVDSAEALLVAGSSLTVYSGYRFVLRAAERGIPVCIVNLGATRGDPLASVRIDGLVTDVLPRVAAKLGG